VEKVVVAETEIPVVVVSRCSGRWSRCSGGCCSSRSSEDCLGPVEVVVVASVQWLGMASVRIRNSWYGRYTVDYVLGVGATEPVVVRLGSLVSTPAFVFLWAVSVCSFFSFLGEVGK